MIMMTRCIKCGEEFDYSPMLDTAKDVDNILIGLDLNAPEFCEHCDFDPLDEMDFLEHP